MPALGSELEMSKDLQKMIKQNVGNRPYLKRTFQRPVFAEESYPLVDNRGAGGSVFRLAAQDNLLTPTGTNQNRTSTLPINLYQQPQIQTSNSRGGYMGK